MTGWQWRQLDHMQVICILLWTDNHASTWSLSFYRPDALPAAQPTASKHWRQYQTRTALAQGPTNCTSTFDHDFWPWPAIPGELLSWPADMQKVTVKSHSVQKLQWKQRDGRMTDGQRDGGDCIAWLANATGNKIKSFTRNIRPQGLLQNA